MTQQNIGTRTTERQFNVTRDICADDPTVAIHSLAAILTAASVGGIDPRGNMAMITKLDLRDIVTLIDMEIGDTNVFGVGNADQDVNEFAIDVERTA